MADMLPTSLSNSKNIEVKQVPLVDIRPYEKNSRVHKDEQIRQIANSIKEFGWAVPIVLDENFIILAGHGRYLAAKLLELEAVPAIQLHHLSESRKRAFRIADNKIASNSEWDMDMLRAELADLEISCDFDLQLTGFSTIEIDVMLDEKPAKATIAKEDIVPYVPNDEIVTKLNDIWQIGEHRIICGSALDESAYEKLMQGKLGDS
jgi:ParB-like chromosome segregation protein Spo0J